MSRRVQAALPAIDRMLAAGMGKAAIARKIGVSVVTVYRREAEISPNKLNTATDERGPSVTARKSVTNGTAVGPQNADPRTTWREVLDGLFTRHGRRDPRYRAGLRAWAQSFAGIDDPMRQDAAESMAACGGCLPDDLDRSPCPGHVR